MARLFTNLAFLVVALTFANAHEFTAGGITVAHPWARATPGNAKNGAVFLEIKAAGGVQKGDRLVGAISTVAERVEIHDHVMEQGISKMHRVDGVTIPAGASVIFSPHSLHVMLAGLYSPLKEGDSLALTLMFERAGEIRIEATIEPVGAMGPHGLDHQPTEKSAKGSHSHK